MPDRRAEQTEKLVLDITDIVGDCVGIIPHDRQIRQQGPILLTPIVMWCVDFLIRA